MEFEFFKLKNSFFKDLNSRIYFFYLIVLLISLTAFSSYAQFPSFTEIKNGYYLLEASSFLKYFGLSILPIIILTSLFVFSFLSIFLFKRFIIVRILIFLSLLFYGALISSFGKTFHWLILITFISFSLIFYKNERSRLYLIHNIILKFIVLAYFISGSFKIFFLIKYLPSGIENTYLYPKAIIDATNMNIFLRHGVPVFSELIGNSILNSISYVIGIIIEVSGLFIFLFKKPFIKYWGGLVLLMHFFILAIIGPDFKFMAIVVLAFTTLDFKHKNAHKISFSSQPQNFYLIAYDGDGCITCSRFLMFLSKFNIPNDFYFTPLSSTKFKELSLNLKFFKNLDSIIFLEIKDGCPVKIYSKSKAIFFILSRIVFVFKPLLLLNFINEFNDIIYDLIAKNRKIDHDNCSLPPVSISNKMI